MDAQKVEGIRTWIANTTDGQKVQRPNNLPAVHHLSACSRTVGLSFARPSANLKLTATRPAFSSIQAPSIDPSTNFRPYREGILIDVRTPSEIDRDEAEARTSRVASRPSAPISRPAPHNYTFNPKPPSARQPYTRKNGRGGAPNSIRHHNMVDIKQPNLPPHMRNRPAQAQHVPPHLRNAQHNAGAGREGAHVPPHLRNAHHNTVAGPEGGGALGSSAAFSGATSNNRAALNGGIALHTRQDVQSSSQSITAPVSPITTAPAQPEQTQQTNEWSNAWNQNPPPTGPRAPLNTHGMHQQGSTQGKSKRNSKWITNKEIRERAKESGEPVGAWGSNGSDAGFNSNPGDDPQHDLKKLVDWEGNWLPGPTDWESRRSYHHHNFNEEMMRFVHASIDREVAIELRNEPTFLDEVSGEVAPRIWASICLEGTSLQEWWNNHIGSPLADTDSKAWWRTYASEESSLLVPHDVPEAKVDPADDEGRIHYAHDLGSGYACDKLIEKKNKKKADREKRNAREREFHAASAAAMPPATFLVSEKIKPKIGLYIRPALAADAHQIAGIYNHYIQNSIRSAEVVPLSIQELFRRIADETSSGMPWLVACQKGKKAGRGYTNGTDASVLGFACASDYLSRRSMYAFTAEAEIYVHPDHVQKGVGSCLVDRLLYVLDPFYRSLEGYQFTGTGPFAENGGSRVIGSVIMNVPFDKRDPEDLKHVVDLLGKFNFNKEAELSNIGVKKERQVSLAMFRYTTGNTIDPKSALIA